MKLTVEEEQEKLILFGMQPIFTSFDVGETQTESRTALLITSISKEHEPRITYVITSSYVTDDNLNRKTTVTFVLVSQ